MKIILASASPRRKELLARLGLEFEVFPSRGEEMITKEVPSEIVMELARQKAVEVLGEVTGAMGKSDAADGIFEEEFLIIGADTVVVNDGKILGKPHDAADACRMLRALSGKTHQVYTGVCLLLRNAGELHGGYSVSLPLQSREIRNKEVLFFEETDVTFYPMTEEEIRSYAATGDPMDKAGAYGIQGICGKHIKGIRGDYNNVVGLPIARLYQEMKMLLCKQ